MYNHVAIGTGRERLSMLTLLHQLRVRLAARLARLGRPWAEVRRVHVGCGPRPLPGWHNVDIKPLPEADSVFDVTKRWPFQGLDYVYAEHFLEHLALTDAMRFLARAGRSLRVGGCLRLSTPNLAYVMRTHFRPRTRADAVIEATFKTNRAFHGWGHRFLYSEAFLRWLLTEVGFVRIRFHAYGESDNPDLRGLERHGDYKVGDGLPSVLIAEALRGTSLPHLSPRLLARARDAYLRYVED